MASPVAEQQPPAYESLIRGDRNVPSYVDMTGPAYESIIETEPYYVMPNPPATSTSVERKSTLYDNIKDKPVSFIYADTDVDKTCVDRSPSQDR